MGSGVMVGFEGAEHFAARPNRVNVLGVGVSAISIPMALAQFERWVATAAREYVCVADVHAIMQSRWDENFRKIHNSAGMVTPDGMPLVWLCHLAGFGFVSRVYGPDLLLATCAWSVPRGYRHFFYGGQPGVAEELIDHLSTRFPGLEVCGHYTPPFRPLTAAEENEVAARIEAARPHFVWVGLSTPKQERWMATFRHKLSAPVLVGVGAAFDFHSGRKPQAPRILQKSGLEWFFRLSTEPKRLGPRYRRVIPGFLFNLVLQKLGFRVFSLPEEKPSGKPPTNADANRGSDALRGRER